MTDIIELNGIFFLEILFETLWQGRKKSDKEK
jgi:hypothetical protein